MMEMKVVLSAVLQRRRLDLVPGLEPTLDAQVTLCVGGGLIVTPRLARVDAVTARRRLGAWRARAAVLAVAVAGTAVAHASPDTIAHVRIALAPPAMTILGER